MSLAVAVSVLAQVDPPRAFDPAKAANRKPGTTVRVDLIGDSTQTNNAGYGRGFCANLTPNVDCVNMSRGGASTKTYREMGLWANALVTKPDYMLIQFGHNDQETKAHLERQVPIGQYESNLRRYVDEARTAGIKPVLVTPLTRRYYGADGKIHSDLTLHAETMKRVAAEMKVPLIDLQADSIAYLEKIGEAEGMKLGITKKDEDGKTIPDKTHLDWAGSFAFGRIVAVDMGKTAPELAKYVLPQAATLPLRGEKAMRVIEGGPVKIVLVGDSTVNAEGGWGKGFCDIVTANVTCVNMALNGRSSKSFIAEGVWKKALAEKGDYYLIQFGHNDQPGKGSERETDPETTYAANLRRYIHDAEAIGAVPVVVTSLSRRNYRDGQLVEDLTAYVNAAKRVAAEEDVTLVDLNAMSVKLLKGMTQAEADGFDATTHPDAAAENKGPAKPDRTHLNTKGQAVFGRMVADSLIRTQVELGPDIIGQPANAGSRSIGSGHAASIAP
jgi:lysophospholipase L1-like esterase